MWQVTVFRIILVTLTGVMLFWCLLLIIGWGEGKHLKKRTKTSGKEREGLNAKIVLIYLTALCFTITLCFLINKYWIRGAE